MSSQKPFDLEKLSWTDSDFESLSWHDCKIHAISFNENFELSLDIDYIVKWVLKGKKYKFWISPCTLVFENVYNIELDNSSTDLYIDSIERDNPKKPMNGEFIDRELEYSWSITLVSGGIYFQSVGFTQYIRSWPVFQSQYFLSTKQRGGVSFERKIAM